MFRFPVLQGFYPLEYILFKGPFRKILISSNYLADHPSLIMWKWIFGLLVYASYCSAVESGIPLYYWKSKNIVNFGDHLSLKLVERIVESDINAITLKSELDQHKLLAIGSIMTMAREGDIIWGSGVKSEDIPLDRYLFTNLDIRSVRGPKTRDFLKKKLGIDCPDIYGDPALLLPYFFPEFKRKESPLYEYIIIPHYSEMEFFKGYSNIVSSTDPFNLIIEKILSSKLVIASSLHGVIVAEAFGVPARLLRVTNNQPLFKYEDYYEGTGRPDFTYAESVEEAILMGGERPFICNLERLYASFPFEYWPESSPRKLL